MTTNVTTNGADQRVEVIRGLRELAEFLESNPAVPTPAWVIARNSTVGAPVTKVDLLAVGGAVSVDGNDVYAEREFARNVKLRITARAKDICVEREVTKSEFVLPEELAPPEPVSELSPADTTAVTW